MTGRGSGVNKTDGTMHMHTRTSRKYVHGNHREIDSTTPSRRNLWQQLISTQRISLGRTTVSLYTYTHNSLTYLPTYLHFIIHNI